MFNQITLEHCPGLTNLLGDNERIEELMKLSPEAILLRWVNFQLEKSGTNRRCANFSGDITDSEVYTYLLKQIAPLDAGVTMEALRVYKFVSCSGNLFFKEKPCSAVAAVANCFFLITHTPVTFSDLLEIHFLSCAGERFVAPSRVDAPAGG